METPFDRRLRRLRRDRAASSFGRADYIYRHAAEGLIERFEGVTRLFADALVLGGADGGLAAELRNRGMKVTLADPSFAVAQAHPRAVQCDEDRLPFADRSFDLAVSVGLLDSVNDLPGALTLIRRCLRPDGLFLAVFAGAGSLPTLRSAMQAADSAASGGVAPHIHPQIDVRAAGDLLSRAGFARPVADTESLTIRFASFAGLVSDLRAIGATNVLNARNPLPLPRHALAAATADFAARAELDGKTSERVEIVYLTGWAPSQGKPA